MLSQEGILAANVSADRVKSLLRILKQRMPAATGQAINHVQVRGTLQPVAAQTGDICCVPDGGACCLNRHPN